MTPMRITKYGHACLLLEQATGKLIIDPGQFTELPPDLRGIKAIVITHQHADHFYLDNLRQILAINPEIPLYLPAEAAANCRNLKADIISLDDDLHTTVAGFDLNLYHIDHAIIYKAVPCKNLAVWVNQQLYYPGDSLHVIQAKIQYLAVPLSAPWLSTADYLDFALKLAADLTFPVHNGLLNDRGQAIMSKWLKSELDKAGRGFAFIKDGQTVP